MRIYLNNGNRKFGEDPSEEDFLVEIQEGDNIDIYDTIEYKGKVYRTVCRSCTKDWCLVEEVDYDAYGEPEEETWEGQLPNIKMLGL